MEMVLLLKWGGLGDSLAFSTLPELCYKNNMDFYLSSQSKNIFRNNEIFDLVWKHNPYFKGFSDKAPNAGNIHISNSGRKNDNDSIVQCFETIYFKESVNKYPRIYYDFKYIEKYKNYTIVDLTSITLIDEYKNVIDDVINILNNILPDDYYLINFNNINTNSFNIKNIKKTKNDPIFINNIYEYCDLINSCVKSIFFNSGANSLSSAIKQDKTKPEINTISFKRYYNTYIYDNIEYFFL